MKNLCVFISSNLPNDDIYVQKTIELAETIAINKFALVYGGANNGLMGILANRILELGGVVKGVITKELASKGLAHNKLTQLHVVDNMGERKALMQTLSDYFVVMPGGLGTLEEVFEIWNAKKIGLHHKSIYFLDLNGYYSGLINYLKCHSVKEGFTLVKHLDLVLISSSIPDLFKLMVTENKFAAPDLNKTKENIYFRKNQ